MSGVFVLLSRRVANILLLASVVAVFGSLGCASAPVEEPAVEPGASVTKKRLFTRRKGTLARKPLEEAIQGFTARFSECYQSLLSRTRGMTVRLTVGFSISEEGQATRLTVVEAVGADQAMNHCVLDVLAGVEFPSPNGGPVDVIWPFEFIP